MTLASAPADASLALRVTSDPAKARCGQDIIRGDENKNMATPCRSDGRANRSTTVPLGRTTASAGTAVTTACV